MQPDSQAVLSGQVVKLSCWATGHPFVQYQWFKQEKEVMVDNNTLFNIFTMRVDSSIY